MTTSEFDVINKHFRQTPINRSWVSLGPGDDCAVLKVPEGEELCVSTDTLIEGVHFPEQSPAEVVASRILAANLSDLAAMGAMPLGCVLAATLPKIDNDWLEAFASTLAQQTEEYGVPLVGGNLARGSLSFTMTVMGSVPCGEAITRGGSKPGDEIHVTGSLGDAAKGLELCRAGQSAGYLVKRYTNPVPRLAVGMALRGLARSMIDISDGLASEVHHLCAAEELGAELDVAALPISRDLLAVADREAATRLALCAGDDYELCFTAAPEKKEAIRKVAKDSGTAITRIGLVVEQTDAEQSGVVIRQTDGQILPCDDIGYRHF